MSSDMPGAKKVFIKTYGCQMNVYDSERMAEAMEPLGYETSHDIETADVVVLNTCHIREKAAEKVYSELGRIGQMKAARRAEGRPLTVAVAGCVAQAEGQEIVRRAPMVDVVVGPQNYHRLPEYLFEAQTERRKIVRTDFPEDDKFQKLPKRTGNRQASAFLTVQEGCDKFCTFCVVPYTRGMEFSRPVHQVLEEARALVDRGVREVTVLGQNVNAYHGADGRGGTARLSDLLAALEDISGLEHLDKVVDIDQSPIGRTPRSNPATYTGLFTPIRELFAQTQEARARGYKPGRFSFNVRGGRCEACQGDGVIKVEMHFLPDIYVPCDVCKGKRYNRETLDVRYKGRNINEVLEMTVEEAREFFDAVPMLARKLQTLMDVGLSYIRLGQSATTLSGGEAQRVKLSRELSKRDTGTTLYILDEPTTGLHFEDIAQLLAVLHRLRDQGNTVVVIEHNLDVIKTADWIIDLGPEGGAGGGRVVAVGTPEQLAKKRRSHTGRFLQPVLDANRN